MPAPTYRKLGDHSETVQLDFDPNLVSYDQLLDVFFASHDPTARPRSRQYMSAIFCHDEDQERAARQRIAELEEKLGTPIFTAVQPYERFYRAEDYHQKYYLQQRGALFREILALFSDFPQLVDSTAAARLNGYVAGLGDEETVIEELQRLGLSAEDSKRLLGPPR